MLHRRAHLLYTKPLRCLQKYCSQIKVYVCQLLNVTQTVFPYVQKLKPTRLARRRFVRTLSVCGCLVYVPPPPPPQGQNPL